MLGINRCGQCGGVQRRLQVAAASGGAQVGDDVVHGEVLDTVDDCGGHQKRDGDAADGDPSAPHRHNRALHAGQGRNVRQGE